MKHVAMRGIAVLPGVSRAGRFLAAGKSMFYKFRNGEIAEHWD